MSRLGDYEGEKTVVRVIRHDSPKECPSSLRYTRNLTHDDIATGCTCDSLHRQKKIQVWSFNYCTMGMITFCDDESRSGIVPNREDGTESLRDAVASWGVVEATAVGDV
ncbi:hypothetical protein DMENIID0001_007430 [Sergentomyia squamirostris]